MIRKIGIVGLGLIGGSLAKAARSFAGVEEIVACNRSADALENAQKEGVIDRGTQTIDHTFSDCDIIFLCTPVRQIYPFAQQLAPMIGKECILTDVGSTKSQLARRMQALAGSVTYIGGHPMTGSERSRYGASRAHLFENAYYLLTPGESTPPRALATLKAFVEQIGAIPVILPPQAHDHAGAYRRQLGHVFVVLDLREAQSFLVLFQYLQSQGQIRFGYGKRNIFCSVSADGLQNDIHADLFLRQQGKNLIGAPGFVLNGQ